MAVFMSVVAPIIPLQMLLLQRVRSMAWSLVNFRVVLGPSELAGFWLTLKRNLYWQLLEELSTTKAKQICVAVEQLWSLTQLSRSDSAVKYCGVSPAVVISGATQVVRKVLACGASPTLEPVGHFLRYQRSYLRYEVSAALLLMVKARAGFERKDCSVYVVGGSSRLIRTTKKMKKIGIINSRMFPQMLRLQRIQFLQNRAES